MKAVKMALAIAITFGMSSAFAGSNMNGQSCEDKNASSKYSTQNANKFVKNALNGKAGLLPAKKKTRKRGDR